MLRPRVIRAVIAFTVLFAATAQTWGQQDGAPEAFGKVYHCRPGPWGTLEYYHVRLEIPDWMLDSIARPSLNPTWSFPGGTEANLRALFEKANLPAALQDYLLNPSHREVLNGVFTVYPPVPDVIAMTPAQRAIIYAELAKSETNASYARPLFILNGDPDSWFERSGLRPELIEMAKKLTYMQGEVLCLSDLGVLLGMARSKSEARDIVRTMNRTSSLVLQLKLKAIPNLEQVVAYWMADRRNKDIEPMLRSAVTTDGNDLFDVTHLLPSLPRRYLDTYYSGDVPIVGTLPNCHWTSLNFFNTVPLDYHRDPRLATVHVNEDYTPVAEPYGFGDVLMFLSRPGTPMHSCVYIADDIVYTKNGQSAVCPWILMKFSDVKRIYSRAQPITIQGYRLKNNLDKLATGE